MYFGDRLLTDNWFSGYPYPNGDGALEVGITYLAGENPGLLQPGAELRVLILPIKKVRTSISHVDLCTVSDCFSEWGLLN